MRSKLPPRVALPVLIQHLKLPMVLRAEDPAIAMQQLGVVVAATPVFTLCIARDWLALEDAVAQIISWHQEALGDAVASRDPAVVA